MDAMAPKGSLDVAVPGTFAMAALAAWISSSLGPSNFQSSSWWIWVGYLDDDNIYIYISQ